MLQAFPYFLEFKNTFNLSGSSRNGTHNLYLRLQNNGIETWGEAVFPPYIDENIEDSIKIIRTIKINFNKTDFKDFINHNCAPLKNNPSLRAALEACLIKYWSALKNIPISQLIEVDPGNKPTSVTISISSNKDMIQQINQFSDASYFKLKISELEVERIITTYLQYCEKPFSVDANQGFRSRNKALYWCERLKNLGVLYFEQPFHKQDYDNHLWLKDNTEVKIIADESIQNLKDVQTFSNYFDGYNVKIIKCGGLMAGKEMLDYANKNNLTTVLGCMSGSSVSIDYANYLNNLASYVDLDGPFLIKNNPTDLSKLFPSI